LGTPGKGFFFFGAPPPPRGGLSAKKSKVPPLGVLKGPRLPPGFVPDSKSKKKKERTIPNGAPPFGGAQKQQRAKKSWGFFPKKFPGGAAPGAQTKRNGNPTSGCKQETLPEKKKTQLGPAIEPEVNSGTNTNPGPPLGNARAPPLWPPTPRSKRHGSRGPCPRKHLQKPDRTASVVPGKNKIGQ